jgi:hypothetical protein
MKKSNAILDYVVVFSVAVIAIIVMAWYIRNSLAAKTRETGDSFGGGEIYQPYEPNKTVIN